MLPIPLEIVSDWAIEHGVTVPELYPIDPEEFNSGFHFVWGDGLASFGDGNGSGWGDSDEEGGYGDGNGVKSGGGPYIDGNRAFWSFEYK